MVRRSARRGTIRRIGNSPLLYVLAALALVMAACSSGSDGGSEGSNGTEELVIGVLSLESGFFATLGIPYQTAMQIAVDEVNDQGGLEVGDKTYHVTLDVQDTKLDVPTALSIAEEMITRDGIKFIMSVGDPIDTAVAPLTNRNKVIMLAETINLEPVEEGVGPYTFGTLPTPYECSIILFEALAELHPEATRVAFVGPDFEFSRIQWEGIQEGGNEVGGLEFGAAEFYADPNDAASIAQRTIADDPDVILIGSVGLDGAAIIRAIRNLGYDGLFATAHAQPSSAQLIDAFEGQEELIEEYLSVEDQPYMEDNAALQTLFDEYSERAAGTEITPEGLPTFYAGILTLFQALQDAGTVSDPDAIVDALENVSVKTPVWTDLSGNELEITYGGVEKLGHDHQIEMPVAVNVIRGGEVETLDVQVAEVE